MSVIAVAVASGAASGALAAALLWRWMAKRMEFAATMSGANFILADKQIQAVAESLKETLQVVRELEAEVAQGAQLISTLFAVTEAEKTMVDGQLARIRARLEEIEKSSHLTGPNIPC